MTTAPDSVGSTGRVLLVGPADAGKTHYGAVLLERWCAGRGALELLSPPDDLTAFAEARAAIQQGKCAPHTPKATFRETPIRLRTRSGRDCELLWEEYGGETLADMLRLRRFPPLWCSRIRDTGRWLLMIRPGPIEKPVVAFPKRGASVATGAPAASVTGSQAGLVELLQLFLDVAGLSAFDPAALPRLAVVLSCWDEMPNPTVPDAVLVERCPLLSAFLKSVWPTDRRAIWGVSSLGRSLSQDEPDVAYRDAGPQQQGYLVLGDGTHSEALDEPLRWLGGGE